MDVGIVGVRVRESLVPVRVAMRLPRGIVRAVFVLMVRVVDIEGMLVLERLVDVLVLVTFRRMQPYSYGHEDSGDCERRCQRITEEIRVTQSPRQTVPSRNTHLCARSQVGEGQARIARGSARSSGNRARVRLRPRAPVAGDFRQPARFRRSTAPAISPFQHRNLYRVASRYLLREIIVDPPGQAGTCDCERTDDAAHREIALPRQYHATRDNRSHAERDSPVDIFTKGEPRQQRREDAFEIEKQ